MTTSPPPRSVVDAFAPGAAPVALDGGQSMAFRAGDVVLKPAPTVAEAEWSAETLDSLHGDGFRAPKPVRTASGEVVVEGWCAWTYLEGEPAGRNGGRWPETLAASAAFHQALAHLSRPPFLDARTDPWSIADRIAFGDMPLQCSAAVREIVHPLIPLLEPVRLGSQVIHGDFTANVVFADGMAPGVIDFTPYWRPALFARAIVAVDALSWAGLSSNEAAAFSGEAAFPQMFARAALRRLLEFDQHLRRGHGRASDLPAHARAVEAAVQLLAR